MARSASGGAQAASLAFSAACRKAFGIPMQQLLRGLGNRRQAADDNRRAACAPQIAAFACVREFDYLSPWLTSLRN